MNGKNHLHEDQLLDHTPNKERKNKKKTVNRIEDLKNSFAFVFSLWAMLVGSFIFITFLNIPLRKIVNSYHVLRSIRNITGDLIYLPLLVLIYFLATFVIIPCIDRAWFRRWLQDADIRSRRIIAGISGTVFIIILAGVIFFLLGIRYGDAFIYR